MSREAASPPALSSEVKCGEFFVVRTPLISVDDLLRWTDVAQDWPLTGSDSKVAKLRHFLTELMRRPELRHAIYVASPSLFKACQWWLDNPHSPKHARVERALVRYLFRMSTRPTPFGLFAGWSVGKVDTERATQTHILLAPTTSNQILCRLDFDCLWRLFAVLVKDPSLAGDLTVVRNSSLHRVGNNWHYIEARGQSPQRTYHFSKVASTAYLDKIIEAARTGKALRTLEEDVLRQAEPSENISKEEAAEFIDELITNNILEFELTPALTGGDALEELVATLRSHPRASIQARTLSELAAAIASIETSGIGATANDYEKAARHLSGIVQVDDEQHIFQVDMLKPAVKAVIGEDVVEEVVRGLEALLRLGEVSESPELERFRKDFTNRYERAWVPLSEVFDEEVGIGFGATSGDFPRNLRGVFEQSRAPEPVFRGAHELMLRKLAADDWRPKGEVSFEPTELPSPRSSFPLPNSFSVMFTIASSKFPVRDCPDWRLWLRNVSGPSGAKYFGRFCSGDQQLTDAVRSLLRAEEAADPGAVYAEVVYAPEGRIGNVLCRPVLRDYEIAYLGRSGASSEQRLAVDDILVTVDSPGTILLWSRSLNRRVIPRLTTAHGYNNPRLAPLYRFLCNLEQQHVAVPWFSWGPLAVLDWLPRVRVGRVILSSGRWRLSAEEIAEVGSTARRGFAFDAVQHLRQRRRLPRWLVFSEGDHALTVDLDNPLSVDAFVQVLLREPKQALCQELFPSLDQQCVTGPEGRYCHEIILPFTRVSKAVANRDHPRAAASVAVSMSNSCQRVFMPGDEWVYAKVYGGSTALDELLQEDFPTLLERTRPRSNTGVWFFIRYADPEPHLRIRFRCTSPESIGYVRQEILNVCQARHSVVWRVSFDTYQREIERYGGIAGIEIAEDIFAADSDAVVKFLQVHPGDAQLRWLFGALGIDLLLADFGISLNRRAEIVRAGADALFREFRVGKTALTELGNRFRADRVMFSQALEGGASNRVFHQAAVDALTERSARVASSVSLLRDRARNGQLSVDPEELVGSYVHLHVNRLIRSNQRAFEMVLLDFLHRWYQGRLARYGQA